MDWSPKCQPWPETLGHQDAVKQMRTHHTWWGCMDATSIWIQVKYWVVLAGQRNHNKKLCSYTTETPGKHEIESAPMKNNWYMGTVFKASYVSKPFQLESCKDFFWQPGVGGTSFPQWSESSPGMLEAARSVGRYQVKVQMPSKIMAFAAFLALASFAVRCQNRVGWDAEKEETRRLRCIYLCNVCRYSKLAEVWVLSNSSHTATAVTLVALTQ